jgi:hypothetical protein
MKRKDSDLLLIVDPEKAPKNAVRNAMIASIFGGLPYFYACALTLRKTGLLLHTFAFEFIRILKPTEVAQSVLYAWSLLLVTAGANFIHAFWGTSAFVHTSDLGSKDTAACRASTEIFLSCLHKGNRAPELRGLSYVLITEGYHALLLTVDGLLCFYYFH